MTEGWKSLSYSRWDCKYHVVFIPKYRRKVLYGKDVRKYLGPVFHELARQKPDHRRALDAGSCAYRSEIHGRTSGGSTVSKGQFCPANQQAA